MPSLDDFRQETRQWLAGNCPESIRGSGMSFAGGRKSPITNEDFKRWFAACVERGFTVPSWPAQYGGAELSPEEVKVLDQELRAIKAPRALAGMGTSMIGPTLLELGSDEQKARHLPGIASGEIRWCQGYSEPGAGSDLASLQTKAESDGDDYIVNGSKIWTSGADLADWIFCLVRTDFQAPKHEGISFILFPMDDPGVSVKPIELISGSSPFCETFFTDVRVSKKDRIGTENRGWAIAKRLLQHERYAVTDPSSGSGAGNLGGLPMDLKEYIGEIGGRIADDTLRDSLVQSEMNTRAFDLTILRTKQEDARGDAVTFATSRFKYYSTELSCKEDEIRLRAMGTQGLGWEGDGFSNRELAMGRRVLHGRALKIAGGTDEVQLNIIAKRVLGLPD
jgi:acyl-CoA dehydrogenase